MEITKKTTFGEMLSYDYSLGELLLSAGMHCAFCPGHAYETLEEGCLVHGIDPDDMIATIQEYEASKA